MSYIAKKAEILRDDAASSWVKKVIRELGERDIIDALNDLELLQDTLMLKWDEAVKAWRAAKLDDKSTTVTLVGGEV